jgi:hypothetical protein
MCVSDSLFSQPDQRNKNEVRLRKQGPVRALGDWAVSVCVKVNERPSGNPTNIIVGGLS